jgi:putative ABC transport system permease protein
MRLRRRRGASVIAIVCLASGMGASAMALALADATLVRPYGLPRAADLVVLWESDPGRPDDLIEISLPTFQDWERQVTSFASIAAFGSSHWPGIGRARGESFAIAPRAVSRRFFQTLGRGPLLGRDFTAADLSPANPPPAILSHGVWMSRFGGSPTVLGESLVIDNEVHQIVGVMPRGFAFPDAPDVWISVERALARAFESSGTSTTEQRAVGVLQAVGRLEGGRCRQHALSELNAIEIAIGQEYAGSTTTDAVLRSALRAADPDLVLVRSQTTREVVDGVLAPSRLLSAAMTMLGATGLMLLALGIFGAAATMLRVARRETAIRQAVGATPFRAARAPLRSLGAALTLGTLGGAALAPGGVGLLAAMGVAASGDLWMPLGVAAASVATAAGVAIGLSIRQATATSPAELLRSE